MARENIVPPRIAEGWTNEHQQPLRFYRIPRAGLELRVVYQGVGANHHRFHVVVGRALAGGGVFMPTKNPRADEGHNPVIEQVGLVHIDTKGATSAGHINDNAWLLGVRHALALISERGSIPPSLPDMHTEPFDPRFDAFQTEDPAPYGRGPYGAFDATRRISACPRPKEGEFRWMWTEACINRAGSKKDVPVINTPAALRDFLMASLGPEIESGQEWFGIVTMDVRLKPTAIWTIFKGGVSNTPVFPSLVFQAALLVPETHGFVLWHTHPSGAPDPSVDDRNLTDRIRTGAEMVGLLCRDHVILAPGGGYYSFVEHGLWRS